MTARTAKKKRTSKARRDTPLSRLEGQLPPTLREYAAELRRRLDSLERDLARAQLEARRRAARLLRDASHQLGRLEVGGEAAWRKLGASYQKDLVALLKRLEKVLAPQVKAPRKPARPKAASRSADAPAGEAQTTG